MHDRLFEASVSGRDRQFCVRNNIPFPHIHDMPYEDKPSLEYKQQSKMKKRLFFENNYENILEKHTGHQAPGQSLMFDINSNLRRKTQKLCANQFER